MSARGASLGGSNGVSEPAAARFENRTVTVGTDRFRYRVYLPPEYVHRTAWPVVLSLHGAGECGTDGVLPSQGALADAISHHPEQFPCLVVYPQSRNLDYWTGEMEDQALGALQNTVHEFHGDRTRLYLTGCSMGGAGAWLIAAHHPGLFAALVPICGRAAIDPKRAHNPQIRAWVSSGNPYRSIALQIGKTPVWIFHGSADPIVPVRESRLMVTALRQLHAIPRYTEYPGVGHNAWDRAYLEPGLPPWLFAQRLSP